MFFVYFVSRTEKRRRRRENNEEETGGEGRSRSLFSSLQSLRHFSSVFLFLIQTVFSSMMTTHEGPFFNSMNHFHFFLCFSSLTLILFPSPLIQHQLPHPLFSDTKKRTNGLKVKGMIEPISGPERIPDVNHRMREEGQDLGGKECCFKTIIIMKQEGK